MKAPLAFTLLLTAGLWIAGCSNEENTEPQTSQTQPVEKTEVQEKTENTKANQAQETTQKDKMSDDYPLPWIEDVTLDITKTLVKNKIKVCGQYKYRASIKHSSEYLVACSPQEGVWYYFLVFTASQSVQGPYSKL